MSQHHKTTGNMQAQKLKFKGECQDADARCWLCSQPINYEPVDDHSRPASNWITTTQCPHTPSTKRTPRTSGPRTANATGAEATKPRRLVLARSAETGSRRGYPRRSTRYCDPWDRMGGR